MLAKGKLGGGATEWAQGGIAAVLEEGDSFDAHVSDTMIAGAGLNNRAVVEHVVGGAPAAIARLAELGVPFNLDDDGDGWHLTQRGRAQPPPHRPCRRRHRLGDRSRRWKARRWPIPTSPS